MRKWLSASCLASLCLMAVGAKAADAYTIDPSHSYVVYHISHLGFSTQSGKWFANGTLTLDEQHPQNSKANVVIQVDSLDTGIAELDKHLKGPLFFDTQKYPTATFVSNKITVTGKDTATIQGLLTLHGQSKPITLTAKLTKVGVSEITDKMTAGFSAHTSLKRSDFGVNGLLPAVGDDVDMDIQVEAYKAK